MLMEMVMNSAEAYHNPLGYVYADDPRWTAALAAVGALDPMATASYDRLLLEWLAR